MRKYDSINKRNIFIVIIICALILIAFSFFIKRVVDADKKEYELEANSVLYDKDKNMLTLTGTGLVKVKWNGAYYLKYEDEDIALNKQAVVFNNATKMINLYGTVYKINEDESVVSHKDETVIEDTILPKFYKLDDRKYLLVAGEIKSEKGEFKAEHYLIVELDKMGNATLVNNKVNMKTLVPTTLVTSEYKFDIANEKLNFGAEDIDLKKIIGSTNLYEEEEKPNGGGSGSGTGTGSGSGSGSDTGTGSGSGGGSGNGNGTGSGDGTGSGNGTITDNKVYQDKNVSIIKNTIGTNFVSIDYSIYDPKGEYKNVFVEIQNDETKDVETYYLAKNATNLKISRLLPKTKYNFVFKYSYLDEQSNLQFNSFDLDYSITTLMPETMLKVTKLTSKGVSYTLNANSNIMLGATVELYLDDVKVDTYDFVSENVLSEFRGTFDLSNYTEFNYITLKCVKLVYATKEVEADIMIKVKN